jgi:hypothetical protein
MKKDKPYFQLIPEDVLKILPEIEIHFQEIAGYSLDRLKLIISILAIHVRKDNNSGKNKDFWTPLKMAYLREYVPQADKYFKLLMEFGIIERSEQYKKGEQSYKYRFNKDFVSEYKSIELTNPKVLRKILKCAVALRKQNSKKYPVQNNYLRQVTIEPEALDLIKRTFTEVVRFNYALANITRLMNGDIFCKVDSTSCRYHSNITILPKELRQFLRIDNVPLVNIDIRNSQPFLGSLLLADPRKFAKFTHNKDFSKMLENLYINDSEDVKMYCSLTKEGKLYEYLKDEFAKRGQNLTRDDVKKRLLKIMFADNFHTISERPIFRELFPEVNRIFEIIRGNEKGDKFHSFKRFAILLQRAESHIMLEKILKRINIEHPEIVTLTIHDSMITKDQPEHIEFVKKTMNEEFMAFFGVKPLLKVE